MKSLKRYLGISETAQNGDQRTKNPFASSDTIDRQARYLAEKICSGFQLHDRRQRDESVEAFHAVDRNQFTHLTDDEALDAAEAFVDALWAKDDIEKSHQTNGMIDPEKIAKADYSGVQAALERRADTVGMSREYAEKTTEAWRAHKTREDYWTPFLEAQTIELRAALSNTEYPEKPKEGQSGYGPLATRYILAVELHDQHTRRTWEEAIRVMTPYYKEILKAHRDRR